MPDPTIDREQLATMFKASGANDEFATVLSAVLAAARASALAQYTAVLALLEHVTPGSHPKALQAILAMRKSARSSILEDLKTMDPRIFALLELARAGQWDDLCAQLQIVIAQTEANHAEPR